MATINIGKLRVNWRGAFATATVYEKNDAVSISGSSYISILDQSAPAYDNTTQYSLNDLVTSGGNVFRYINSTAASGNATSVATHWSANTPSTSNSVYWNVMAEGQNVLTTQGDLMTHDGSSQIRLPRGGSGQILKVQGSDLAFGAQSGYKGWTALQCNYGDPVSWNVSPSASTTYGATGSRAWLADYANNWIPEYAYANPAMGPIANAEQANQYHSYRMTYFLNNEHELCGMGSDVNSYSMNNILGGNGHSGFTIMNFSQDNGGMRNGDYFVRFWNATHCMFALTKDGDLFARGYNGYGQLGLGDTTDRYMWCKISTLGPDATHAGISTQIAGFHLGMSTCTGNASYNTVYAIDTSGRLFSWGYNGFGQIGNGNATNQSLPQHISSVSNIAMVSARFGSAHIIDTSGNLFFAGSSQNEVDGGLSGGTLSSFTDTGQDNVYQIVNSDGYYYTSRYAHAWYLKTNGEMYGIGGNGVGQAGVGSTTQVGTWSRIGGSATYSGFVVGGNAYYCTVAVKGGTPASPNNTVSIWGYNVNGQCGIDSVTNQTSPTAPSTSTSFTHTVASTTSSTAQSQVDVPFPNTDIIRIWANRGMQGQSTVNMYFQDSKYRTWVSGYSNSQDYNKNSSGNGVDANLQKIRLDIAQENTTGSVTTNHWAGSVPTKVIHIHGQGNAYGSEGNVVKYTDDGRVFAWGYNGQGQLDPAATYVGQWIQLRP